MTAVPLPPDGEDWLHRIDQAAQRPSPNPLRNLAIDLHGELVATRSALREVRGQRDQNDQALRVSIGTVQAAAEKLAAIRTAVNTHAETAPVGDGGLIKQLRQILNS